MDFEREPFRVVDQKGCRVDEKGFYDASSRGVAVCFVDCVVVEVVGTDEAGERGADTREASGVDSVGFFCGDVGVSKRSDGCFEGRWILGF